MKKLAIYVCGDVSMRCTANSCLKSFNEQIDAFNLYKGEAVQLTAFNNCNGCGENPEASLDVKIEKFLKADIDIVHLSTCIRGRCEHYEVFAKKLSEHFDVVGYTHGSALGKKENNINITKKQIKKSAD